ncbi:MAG: hypothetical protein AAGC77_14575 [Pseudomonadota bacterium]
MMVRVIAVVAGLVALFGAAKAESGSDPKMLRLVDRLDRPDAGYCVDIPGAVEFGLATDVPIFVHNCKPTFAADSAMVMTGDGELTFPELDLCVTAAAVNSNIVPGAATLAQTCGEAHPFLGKAEMLQKFVHRDDGRMELAETELCLAVGPASAATFSPTDNWRALFLSDCSAVAPEYSVWEFFTPS